MPSPSPQLEWCVVRLGDDFNWWVDEISDEIHWDVDGLGIIDPRQIQHVIELCEPLREYGFNPDALDQAFFTFRIEKVMEDKRVRLVRTREVLSESEDKLFALPDILDEDKGPYADFLDQITKLRVKMLNDLIEFDHNLTIDELEEEIRERQNNDYVEGRAVHFFQEVTAILEYVPEGFELDDEEKAGAEGEDIEDFPDLDEGDEKLEEDETMRWDEDGDKDKDEDEDSDEEKEEGDEDEDDSDDEDEEEEEAPRPKRRR